jgi:ribosomal protein L11 methylase PrmA
VHARDDDPFAVETASANAAANGVDVEVACGDVTSDELPETRVVVANIALPAVETVAARVRATELVTSGYLERDAPTAPDWTHIERRVLDGWAADRFSRAA